MKTWTGANSPAWNDPGNWMGGVPGVGDDLLFPASAMNFTNVDNLAAGLSLNSITISGAGYNIVVPMGGNSITLGAGGLTYNAAGGGSTFAVAIALSANRTITVTNSPAALVLSGAIGGPAVGFSKRAPARSNSRAARPIPTRGTRRSGAARCTCTSRRGWMPFPAGYFLSAHSTRTPRSACSRAIRLAVSRAPRSPTGECST